MAAALGLAASVIAMLQLAAATISACHNYSSGVRNASRDKKKIIDQLFGLQKVLDDVRDLLEDAEANAPSRLPALRELFNKPDGLPRCRAELETLKAKLETRPGRRDRVQALVWPLKEGEVKKTLDYIGQFQQLLSSTLNVDHIHLALDTQISVKALQEETAASKFDEHCQRVYNWLSASDYRSNHVSACKKRQETTGSWFVQGQRFEEWKGISNSFLWLHGIPGSGKTILCSTTIEELSRHCRSRPSFAIAYFYFDFQSKDTSLRAVLQSLIKQLSLQCSRIPEVLEKLFTQNANGYQPATLEELTSTIMSIIGDFQEVYVVFDALDECPERDELMILLRKLHDGKLDTLHLLATSRKERDIEDTLKTLVSHEVPMDESLVDGDIRVHVSKILETAIEFRMCSVEEKDKIKTTLIDGAHGMFRWVACQLDVLRKCRSPAALEKALKSLPKTLYETYDRILSKIHEEDRRDALRVLHWLAFSVRTISLEEAIEVLATDPDAKDGPLFDPRRRPWDPRNIEDICSSLVTIRVPEVKILDRVDSGDEDESIFTGTAELRLAHFSVREYLISDYLRQGDPKLSYYHTDKKTADIFIAATCVAYLLQFNQRGCIASSTKTTYPLADYAARYWINHAQSDSGGSSDDLHRLMMDLLEPGNAMYRNWLSLFSPDAGFGLLRHRFGSTRTILTGPPLYFTSMGGLERATQSLLSNGWNVNALVRVSKTGCACPLQVASLNGHLGIVRLLLANGADVNLQEGFYGNALHVASSRGQVDVVQLLLEKGADLNAQGMTYGPALEVASVEGQYLIVKLLLERGADVNARGGYYGNALQAAASEGYETIVLLLLENGADVNAHGGKYGNALQAAASGGYETIIRSLLEKGANVNAQGGEHGSALQGALSEGHDAIFRLLLEKGADVNLPGGRYGNVLQAASFKGKDAVCRLLLEKGAELDAQGGRYGSALGAASFNGHEAVVRMLLESGADVNIGLGRYGSALLVALSNGHETIVRMLLKRGADVNAREGVWGNALQIASSKGYDTIVQTLLGLGADVNLQGTNYGSALRAASFNGHEAVVRMLLKAGANINVQGGMLGSTLVVASSNGHEAVVRTLLKRGADVNAQGGDFGNALQAASSKGYDTIVRMLLKKGANVNARGGEFGNALQAASYEGHDSVVRMLLKEGANVSAQGGRYGSALQAASSKGHEGVVRILLESGANVRTYGNALLAGSSNGHAGVVWILLKRGADVNAQGGDSGNALQAASHKGHSTVVRMLLENGADVNAQGGTYGSALQAASLEGHEAIIRMLLESGASVNVQGGTHDSALIAASSKSHEGVVRMLLELGADTNLQGGKYGSALQAASSGYWAENIAIVRLLLEKGADVNMQGGDFGNALQAASFYGNSLTARLLLERGADVNLKGGEYGSALQAASWKGNNPIARLLLERGADVNFHGGLYGTALQAASFNGHDTTVLLLLKNGADVNIQGGEYGTALQAASLEGHDKIVRFLLENRADVNIQGGKFGTALQAASLEGHDTIVRFLLENGADQPTGGRT